MKQDLEVESDSGTRRDRFLMILEKPAIWTKLHHLYDAKPKNDDVEFATNLLKSADKELSIVAARAIASWGGERAYKILEPWSKKSLFQGAAVFAHFRVGSYQIKSKDFKFLDYVLKNDLLAQKHSMGQYLIRAFLDVDLLTPRIFEAWVEHVISKGDALTTDALFRKLGTLLEDSYLQKLAAQKIPVASKSSQSLLKRKARGELTDLTGPSSEYNNGAAGDVKAKVIRGHKGFGIHEVGRKGSAFYITHEDYGDLRVEIRRVGWQHLVDFIDKSPKNIPKGVIKADIDRQNLISGAVTSGIDPYVMAMPRFFYRDHGFACKDCGREDVFEATEQKIWYEDYALPTYVELRRCKRCQYKVQATEILNKLAQARKLEPDNIDLDLTEAKTRISASEMFSKSSLQKAATCLNRVIKYNKNLTEAWYWKGLLDAIRGRNQEAVELLERFVEHSNNDKNLVKHAKQKILELKKLI